MPLFEAIGQRTFRVSDKPQAATLVKLSGNFLIASVIEALSEAMALVAKGGIDQHQYLDILTSTLFTAPVYKTYGGLIADKKFEPAGFAAPLAHKDIRLVLAASESLRAPMPLASLLQNRLLTLIARGGESLDWSAISQLAAEDSGVRSRTSIPQVTLSSPFWIDFAELADGILGHEVPEAAPDRAYANAGRRRFAAALCQACSRCSILSESLSPHWYSLPSFSCCSIFSAQNTPSPNAGLRIIVASSAEQAQQILDRLKNGEDFAALAKEKSVDATADDGGYMGKWIQRHCAQSYGKH